MEININHTLRITASADLLSAIEKLVAVFAGNKTAAQSTPFPKPVKEKANTPAEAAEAADFTQSADTLAKEQTAITIEQVRVAVKAKSDAGKRDELKAILAEYGVASVTALDVSLYPAFLQKVNAL